MNKFLGIGRLTRDPDIRYSQSGDQQMCIARYTLAIDRRGPKKEGQQAADFVSCVAFGKNGEFVEKYLKQGMKIGICGRVQTGSYTNKDGAKIYTTDVVVEEHEFCEKKGETETPPAGESPEDNFMAIPDDIEGSLPFK